VFGTRVQEVLLTRWEKETERAVNKGGGGKNEHPGEEEGEFNSIKALMRRKP